MSERIYLLRGTELQSLVNNTITELLVRAGEKLVANGSDMESVVALVTAVEDQIGQHTDFVVMDPVPVAGFPSLPDDISNGDTVSSSASDENEDEESVKVQVDKNSIFEELKGLR